MKRDVLVSIGWLQLHFLKFGLADFEGDIGLPLVLKVSRVILGQCVFRDS